MKKSRFSNGFLFLEDTILNLSEVNCIEKYMYTMKKNVGDKKTGVEYWAIDFHFHDHFVTEEFENEFECSEFYHELFKKLGAKK